MSDIQIPSYIRNLPVTDRVELVTKIWESIAEDNCAAALSDEHKRLLDQRLREADENPESLIPAEAVFRDLAAES